MTVQEAIKNVTAYVYMECENMPQQVIKALDVLKDSAKECEQYRALGTVEEIIKHRDNLEQENHEYSCLGTVEELKEAREKQPQADLIPCEERLPSESGTYLVTDKVFNGENIRYKTDTAYFNGETWHSDFEGTCNGRTDIGRRVIAWQPLPQPYKKEGAE